MVMLVAALCLVGTGGAAWAVDGGSAGLAHNMASTTGGTCSKCHIPHGGKGDKIWAQDISAYTLFSGVHNLCYTCHHSGGPYTATTGQASVFNLGYYQNHSMLDWANIATGSAVVPSSPAGLFPTSATDTDTIWTVASADVPADSNQGFYCGSCHNPHKQPFTVVNGHGDYLRVDTSVSANITAFGSSGARIGACRQCHPNQIPSGTQISSGHTNNCSVCHNPHRGGDVATTTNASLADKILVVSGTTSPFVATPNVPGFTADSYAQLMAGVCYNCHSTVQVGVRLPDTSAQIFTTLEHHPMGTNAPGADGADHAPGYTASSVPQFGATEVTCTTCHNPHVGTQDFYLSTTAGTYAGTASDDGGYCVSVCHNDKVVADLGAATGGHLRQKTGAVGVISTVTVAGDEGGTAQGQCYMCHAIHDGPARADTELPQLSALMRVPAVNYNEARKTGDGDTLDYEDLCFGCHSNTPITVGFGLAGSRLNPSTTALFTHIFSGTASGEVAGNMTTATLLTATADKVQYGAVDGELYCGTCHNVHVQNTDDLWGEMFRRPNFSTTVKGQLCLDCHGVKPISQGTSGGGSHPIGTDALLPTEGVTASPTVNSQFGSGGNGVTGGRTANGTPGTGPAAADEMVCETCHNFHNSITSRNGDNTQGESTGLMGKLMIFNNSTSTLCSTCHVNY